MPGEDGRMTPAEFKDAREALGLSQPGLADALGIHPMTVSRYERGALTPIPRVVTLAMEQLARRGVKRLD